MQPRAPANFDDFPPQAAKPAAAPKKAPIRVEYPAIDVRLLTEQCLGNLAFGVSLLEKFQATADERIRNLKAKAEHRDFPALAEMAHSLKGVVGILGAEPLLDSTSNLQQAAECKDPEYVDELIPQIEHELQRLFDEIPRLRSLT